MQPIPLPSNEQERLAELRSLRPNEWSVSTSLDELCSLAARLLKVPTAAISLIDAEEVRFVGRCGLKKERAPRQQTLCAYTITASQPLVAGNLRKDPRFANNPVVQAAPHIRAYLGLPLETAPGLRIGSFCAVAGKPRAFSEIDVLTLQELGQIAVSIIRSQRTALDFGDELRDAIALQSAMLPGAAQLAQIQAKFPLELASHYQPRRGIGGDIWGIECIGSTSVMLYAADFMGHGLAAALNTARLHSLVHPLVRKNVRPGALLEELNEILMSVLPAGQFATMFCAIFDFDRQIIKYASAGAPPQLYRASDKEPYTVLTAPGLPLGLARNTLYKDRSAQFLPGGTLFLYTDALIETPCPPHSVFTPKSLAAFLNRGRKHSSGPQLLQRVLRKLNAEPFTARDDLTLVTAACRRT
ncbi:MAG: SpoIIE family protein phosphatase [Rhodomicrobium sp.]